MFGGWAPGAAPAGFCIGSPWLRNNRPRLPQQGISYDPLSQAWPNPDVKNTGAYARQDPRIHSPPPAPLPTQT